MSQQPLGVKTYDTSRTYLSLRSGRICETRSEPTDGFVLRKNKNASGDVFEFYAKEYEEITAYIDEIRWHTHEYDSGNKVSGWNLHLNVGDPNKTFVLQVGSKERPFTDLMSRLANVDFTEPVRLVGFTGKNGNKVLLLYQGDEINEETGRPKPVQAKYFAKWLSRDLLHVVKNFKKGDTLTPEQERNIEFLPDGMPDPNYPYIRETREGWSFDAWTEFLMERMEEDVIPACEAAKAERQGQTTVAAMLDHDMSTDSTSDGPSQWDDDIPF